MPTFTITVEIPEAFAGQRLDQALAKLLPDYSRARLQGWIRAERVLLDGARTQPRARVSAGQVVAVAPDQSPVVESQPEEMPLDIFYEDDDLLVLNKPAGLVVHPGAGNASGTLLNGLLHYAPELAALPRGGIIHRLDKDTSGLLLIARSLRAHTQLIRDLEQREIRREYRAVCNDRLTAGGVIDAAIGRHRVQRIRMAVTEAGKPAVTHYRVLYRFAAHTFLAVRLETGRTHQIRVHFTHAGHPLVGDPVYGGRLKLPKDAASGVHDSLRAFKRQALHAHQLGFKHPADGAWHLYRAPLPDDFVALLHGLEVGIKTDFDALEWPQNS